MVRVIGRFEKMRVREISIPLYECEGDCFCFVFFSDADKGLNLAE